jgi:predicted phosphodiesterase
MPGKTRGCITPLVWCIVTGVKSKFSQLAVFISFFLTSYVLRAEESSFAVVSDTHVGAPNSVYPEVIKRIGNEGISTVIHTGDATHGGNKSQWEELERLTGPDKLLHLVPGNHDVRDHTTFARFLDLFRSPYYSFAHGDTLFLMLNTEIPGKRRRIAGEQLAWLATELDKPFRYKFVFLHEPLFPFLPGNGMDRHAATRDALHLLFVQKRVSLVIAGHDHIYDRTTRDGVQYVIQGATGGRLPWFRKSGKSFKYMVAKRKGDGYSFVVKDMSGRVRARFLVNERSARYPLDNAQWAAPVLARLCRILIGRPYRQARFSSSSLQIRIFGNRILP